MQLAPPPAGVTAAAAQPPYSTEVGAGRSHPVITFPVLGRFYPPRARRAKVEGDVTATCAVTMGGSLTQCAINSESPVGYGFGAATLKALAETRVQIVLRHGVQTPQVLHIPIDWRLPQAELGGAGVPQTAQPAAPAPR